MCSMNCAPSPVLADAPVAEADGQVERVDAEADRDRAVVADRLADELEHLPAEARPVLERAAVLVGPPVEERQEELMEERLRCARSRR